MHFGKIPDATSWWQPRPLWVREGGLRISIHPRKYLPAHRIYIFSAAGDRRWETDMQQLLKTSLNKRLCLPNERLDQQPPRARPPASADPFQIPGYRSQLCDAGQRLTRQLPSPTEHEKSSAGWLWGTRGKALYTWPGPQCVCIKLNHNRKRKAHSREIKEDRWINEGNMAYS